MIRGIVEFALEGQAPVRLAAGDSVIFDSGRAHAAAAVGEQDAPLISAILPHDGSVVPPTSDAAGGDVRHEVPLERPERSPRPRLRDGDTGERRRRRPRRIEDEHR